MAEFKYNPFTNTLDLVGTGSGGAGIASLTGNSGGAILPDGSGNVNVIGSGNIQTSGSGNSLTITESQAQVVTNYTRVTHAQSPYTVLSTDFYIAADGSGGEVSILLPNAPTLYRLFTVKDFAGVAPVTTISISTVGGTVLIDGVAIYLFSDPYEAVDILWNGTSYEVF